MDLVRQWKLLNPDKVPPIDVIGVGSIGSPLALILSKMGVKDITIWDFDKVESHNQPNQMIRGSDIGKLKTEAVAEICKDFSDLELKTKVERYNSKNPKPITICAVDNMNSREEIFDFIEMNPRIKMYWDCRMGGEMFSIFAVNPKDIDDIKRYRETLFSEEEGVEMPCGERSIVYTNTEIASFVAKQIQAYAMGLQYYKIYHFSWQPHTIYGETNDGKTRMLTER